MRSSLLDIKSDFNIVPIIHLEFCGQGVNIFLSVLNRQGKLNKLEAVYFMSAIAACAAARRAMGTRNGEQET